MLVIAPLNPTVERRLPAAGFDLHSNRLRSSRAFTSRAPLSSAARRLLRRLQERRRRLQLVPQGGGRVSRPAGRRSKGPAQHLRRGEKVE